MKHRVTVDFNDKCSGYPRDVIDMMALWLVEANIPHKVRRRYHYGWEKTVIAGNFLVVKAFFYFDDEADALHFVLSNRNAYPGDFALDLRS